MTENEEDKLMVVLEHFLSLHEADEIYNAIFDITVDEKQLSAILDSYKEP